MFRVAWRSYSLICILSPPSLVLLVVMVMVATVIWQPSVVIQGVNHIHHVVTSTAGCVVGWWVCGKVCLY